MEGLFFVLWIFFAAMVGALASSRGRSGLGYFLLAALLSPVIGLVVVLVTRNITEDQKREEEASREADRREADRKREHERELESLRVLAAKAVPVVPAVVPTTKVGSESVADELTKLFALKEKGVLTEAEFTQQKQAVLSRGVPT